MELAEGKEFDYAGKKDTAEKIADYLEEHYADKISLDQIAENMYLSPFYISKIFKSEIGISDSLSYSCENGKGKGDSGVGIFVVHSRDCRESRLRGCLSFQ